MPQRNQALGFVAMAMWRRGATLAEVAHAIERSEATAARVLAQAMRTTQADIVRENKSRTSESAIGFGRNIYGV
jgi:hypothetical protein